MVFSKTPPVTFATLKQNVVCSVFVGGFGGPIVVLSCLVSGLVSAWVSVLGQLSCSGVISSVFSCDSTGDGQRPLFPERAYSWPSVIPSLLIQCSLTMYR